LFAAANTSIFATRRSFTKRKVTVANMRKGLFFLAQIGLAASASAAQPQARSYDDPKWMEPIAPFRIADRLYYVGSRELAAFLIDSDEGLILLDTGVPEFAPRLLANIRTLGFEPKQVKILLNGQAHLDHAGGLAAVKAATGAKMLASAADAELLERGGKEDFAWGDDLTYPPVKVDGIVRDGQRVTLGRVALTAHLTPGHTKGCTTWTMPVNVQGSTLVAQFNCSASIPGYKLLGTPAYPNMAADYERTFATLRQLPCDIFLGAHASFFNLDAKRAQLGKARGNPFVDPEGCRRYVTRMEASYHEQLAREREAAAASGRAGGADRP
jgi:metallo-beta-lactamase class B